MKYLAQIQWDTVFDCAEGTLYVEFCPDCQIVSMQHQQTERRPCHEFCQSVMAYMTATI